MQKMDVDSCSRWAKLGFVETKRRHSVTLKPRCLSAREEGGFLSVMSLFLSSCLLQFCSPLFGFFQLVPGFVEFDQVVP